MARISHSLPDFDRYFPVLTQLLTQPFQKKAEKQQAHTLACCLLSYNAAATFFISSCFVSSIQKGFLLLRNFVQLFNILSVIVLSLLYFSNVSG